MRLTVVGVHSKPTKLYVALLVCCTRISDDLVVAFPEFEETSISDISRSSVPTSPTSPITRSTRLNRFLDDLNLRPNESPLDLDEPSYPTSGAGGPFQPSASLSGLLNAPSRTSLTEVSAPNGISYTPSANSNIVANRNPEADSFTYIETLLESLAVLGKLGHALDVVAQKLPQEIYNLVETTLDEVAERAEYGRRASINGSVGRMDNLCYLNLSGAAGSLLSPGAIGVPITGRTTTHGRMVKSSHLRLAALDLSTKRVDQEIMRDFFWTLYSKLDAVAQGMRVVYEVSNRIGSVATLCIPSSVVETDVITSEETSRIRRGQSPVRYFRYLKYGCRSRPK